MPRIVVTLIFLFAAVDLKDTWEAGPPAFKAENKELNPSVKFEGEKMIVSNRGNGISTKRFPNGATFSTTWKWTKGREEGNYHDHLCVAFATDGKQRAWPGEIESGIVVRFNSGSGSVGVEKWEKDKKDPKLLAFKDGLTFKRGVAYTLRIVHLPDAVIVSVDDQRVITAEGVYRGDKIAVYNREPVAGVEKESELTEVSLVPE